MFNLYEFDFISKSVCVCQTALISSSQSAVWYQLQSEIAMVTIPTLGSELISERISWGALVELLLIVLRPQVLSSKR